MIFCMVLYYEKCHGNYFTAFSCLCSCTKNPGALTTHHCRKGTNTRDSIRSPSVNRGTLTFLKQKSCYWRHITRSTRLPNRTDSKSLIAGVIGPLCVYYYPPSTKVENGYRNALFRPSVRPLHL